MFEHFSENFALIPSEYEVFKVKIHKESVEYIMDNKIRCDFSD